MGVYFRQESIVFDFRERAFVGVVTLILKGPRPLFCPKPLKIAISIAFIQRKQNKILFVEYNCRIWYFICLRSYGNNFMKFDYIDWKILTFKVGKKISFEAISYDFDQYLEKYFALDFHSLKNC